MKHLFFFLIIFLVSLKINAQAELTIVNNSERFMTVKVMKEYSDNGSLHEIVTISSFMSKTIYFNQSGFYFTKTKAELLGKEPIYQKGQSFQVTNEPTGYSVMTLTLTIKESSIPEVSGGKQISKSEFDQN